MSKFLILSFLMHASMATSLWVSTALKEESFLEVDFNYQPPSVPMKAIKKSQTSSIVSKRISTENIVHSSEFSGFQAEESIHLTEHAQGHPYFRTLWVILKNKKADIRIFEPSGREYRIRFRLHRQGQMSDIEVEGESAETAKILYEALSESPQLPSLPLDISTDSLRIEYKVVY